MSANLVVDLGGTTLSYPSFPLNLSGTLSGGAFVASGGIIGGSVDMLHADTFTNLMITGTALTTSGQLRVQVQVSDSDTSGTYFDPTSGLAQMPTWFESGGLVRLNSGGLLGGTLPGAVVGSTVSSGYCIQSGFLTFAGFQRLGRFCRANIVSGDFYVGNLQVGFVGQLRTTGSGGGYTLSPTSGPVNV